MELRTYLKKHSYLFLLLPPLLVLAVFLLIPLVILLQYSFATHIPGQGMKMVLTLSNYVRFFTDEFYLHGLLITLATGLVVVVISLLLPIRWLTSMQRRASDTGVFCSSCF